MRARCSGLGSARSARSTPPPRGGWRESSCGGCSRRGDRITPTWLGFRRRMVLQSPQIPVYGLFVLRVTPESHSGPNGSEPLLRHQSGAEWRSRARENMSILAHSTIHISLEIRKSGPCFWTFFGAITDSGSWRQEQTSICILPTAIMLGSGIGHFGSAGGGIGAVRDRESGADAPIPPLLGSRQDASATRNGEPARCQRYRGTGSRQGYATEKDGTA